MDSVKEEESAADQQSSLSWEPWAELPELRLLEFSFCFASITCPCPALVGEGESWIQGPEETECYKCIL